jgi:hypothetical protein
VAATSTVAELTARWTERAVEPGDASTPRRKVRALNPLSAAEAALLTAVADPKWAVNGLRNRDLAAALYGEPPAEAGKRKRQSAQVGRRLRLLRAHGILKKVGGTHKYQVCEKSRDGLLAVLAARSANAEQLTNLAA